MLFSSISLRLSTCISRQPIICNNNRGHCQTFLKEVRFTWLPQTGFCSIYHYHPRMRVGNVFSHVCVCVCLCVCLSVQALTFEPLDTETLFLVCRYILTISRSSLSIEVIGSRSRSYEKNDNFTYFNLSILWMWPKVINQVKVRHQGEGDIKVKVKMSSSLPTLCKILLILTYLSSVCGYRSLIRSRSHINVKVTLRSK